MFLNHVFFIMSSILLILQKKKLFLSFLLVNKFLTKLDGNQCGFLYQYGVCLFLCCIVLGVVVYLVLVILTLQA